jgi:integrase
MLIKIADAYTCNKKTYNNAVSALRRAFDFGYLDYPERRDPAASLKCARIGKNDRPPIDPFSIQDAEMLISAIQRDWGEAQGNYDELRFFTGLRPSEEIALVVTDYDAAHGVLSVTKARVLGIDKDVTKTGEDRRIRLCPRAIAVIERQLRLRERLAREGRIDHDRLFFTDSGRPISDLKYPYTRWQRTLQRLAIRYRKPYMARHTSVSWNLMVGRDPLLVAKEHGHRPTTMLSVCAAWTEGAVESDITAIREAMSCTDGSGAQETVDDRAGPTRTEAPTVGLAAARPYRRTRVRRTEIVKDDFPVERRFGSRFGSSQPAWNAKPLKNRENFAGKGGTRTERMMGISKLLTLFEFLSPRIPGFGTRFGTEAVSPIESVVTPLHGWRSPSVSGSYRLRAALRRATAAFKSSGAFHIPDELRHSPTLPNEMISETIARYHLHTRPAARGLCILSERIGS